MTTRRRAFTRRSSTGQRSRRGAVFGRHPDLDGRARPGALVDRQRRPASPYWHASRRSTLLKPDAGRRVRARSSRRLAPAPVSCTTITSSGRRAPVDSSRARHGHVAAAPRGRDAVLDGVLDERLQHQRRHAEAAQRRPARRSRTRSRSSNRARSMSRYDSISSSSRPSVVNSPSERSTLRSSAVSRISVSSARGGAV